MAPTSAGPVRGKRIKTVRAYSVSAKHWVSVHEAVVIHGLHSAVILLTFLQVTSSLFTVVRSAFLKFEWISPCIIPCLSFKPKVLPKLLLESLYLFTVANSLSHIIFMISLIPRISFVVCFASSAYSVLNSRQVFKRRSVPSHVESNVRVRVLNAIANLP